MTFSTLDRRIQCTTCLSWSGQNSNLLKCAQQKSTVTYYCNPTNYDFSHINNTISTAAYSLVLAMIKILRIWTWKVQNIVIPNESKILAMIDLWLTTLASLPHPGSPLYGSVCNAYEKIHVLTVLHCNIYTALKTTEILFSYVRSIISTNQHQLSRTCTTSCFLSIMRHTGGRLVW